MVKVCQEMQEMAFLKSEVCKVGLDGRVQVLAGPLHGARVLPGQSRWHQWCRCRFPLLVHGDGFGLQQTPLFLEVPLPGLLPQVPLQQVDLVHRPPGTPPPAGQALTLLEPTQPLGSEAPGPRAACGCAFEFPSLPGTLYLQVSLSSGSLLLSFPCFKLSELLALLLCPPYGSVT